MKDLANRLPTRKYLQLVNDYHVQLHWSYSGEDVVMRQLVGDREDGFYVDIGAHHPRLYSNTYYFFRVRNWSGINVDATEEKIRIFDRERPDDINLQAVVGAEAGSVVEFEVGSDAGLKNGVLQPGARARDDSSVRRLTSTTLAAILDEHLPDGRQIDILSIDCEGQDLAVLQGGDWRRHRPQVVCVEDFAIRRGRPSKLRPFLEERDYRFVSHCYNSSIYQRVDTPDG